MANVKITELTAITAPASSDVLAIVDVDADVTKKVTIANLVGSAAPGSFGAPSFGFADDDDTGMYRAAADQLGFATTGAERFRIDDAGNLHISGDSKYLYLSSDDNQWIRADASTDFIQIGTGNSERLRIDSSGNVGIGTASPSDVLHVKCSGASQGIKIQPPSDSDSSFISFRNAADNLSRGYVGYNHSDQALVFRSTGSGEQMRIDSSGRLLVGTSSSTNVGSSVPAYIQTRFSSTNVGIAVVRESSNPIIALGRANGTGSQIVSVNQALGEIRFAGADGTDLQSRAGAITCTVDGTPGADDMPGRLTFSTTADGASTPTERMRITSSGNVGIGEASPDSELHISKADTSTKLILERTNSATAKWSLAAGANSLLFKDEAAAAERMRINSSGDVGIGTSSPSSELQVNGDSDTQIRVVCSSGGSAGIQFGDTSDVVRGGINFDATGNNLTLRGYNNTERMRILSDGVVLTQTTSTNVLGGSGSYGHRISASGITLQVASTVHAAAAFNRANNDGSVVEIRQAGAIEGTISVSGSTVSYNGGHLARWSQLPGGAERTEILRGSVLSNLDEMCEWGDEGNEQLNRMQVSSVEGDPNVSGVFQAWDDDDDTYTNDFYCAMTGDFVIRIAQGTTVARGDLLMSAGDGTAKPQDDDIVRSKTIAKVTSTTVSETYSDGSYCVPCVLMAC